MEPIPIYSHPKTHGLSVVEPLTKLELELLARYRRLTSDDQERILSALQGMALLNQTD